ncbi:complex I intermediate-associated protein 30-domain-containing protein [Cladochytrium replicatum]|nr:complex I intermediate-associated protein 30-domain-containing protein [Cladochytrium replicatum]
MSPQIHSGGDYPLCSINCSYRLLIRQQNFSSMLSRPHIYLPIQVALTSILAVALIGNQSFAAPTPQLQGGDEPSDPLSRIQVFGPNNWHQEEWIAVNDGVRGGISQSFVNITADNFLRFNGNIDTTTLGGAGFASQQVTNTPYFDTLALYSYSGLAITTAGGDGKEYSINLKTTFPANISQSIVEYKYKFTANAEQQEFVIKWDQFLPYYRGRPVNASSDVPKEVDTNSIYTVSLLCQSGFDTQKGPFTVDVVSVDAVTIRI